MTEILAAVVGLAVGFAAAHFMKGGNGKPVEAAPSEPSPPLKPDAPKPVAPARNDAVTLLATLQREARFIDIVKEPLSDYSDAQVGAAARDVLRDCATVIDRLFKIEPVVDQEEGASVEIPSGARAAMFRISGSSDSNASSGSLVHHGWQAKQCELPEWTGDKDAAMVVAPAELDVK